MQAMSRHLSTAIPGFAPKWVIDTGRNGVTDERQSCSNWCNIRGAGVGALPTANVSAPAVVDAYFWLKTPGESDGCTQTLPDGRSCARFDTMCASPDSLGTRPGEPRAPEAGMWFDYQIKQLAANARSMGRPPPPPPGAVAAASGSRRCATLPFAQCGGHEGGGAALCCPAEHACEGGAVLRLCMPNATAIACAAQNGPFATALEHARERLLKAEGART